MRVRKPDRKRTKHARVFPETLRSMEKLKLQLAAKQGKPISTAEMHRRIFNIPNLKDVLLRDAELKRRLRRK